MRVIRQMFGLLVVVVSLAVFSASAGADDIQGAGGSIERRLGELEKKTLELEREVMEEHKPLLKEMGEHITTLDVGLDMVDYRTGRIKALSERVDKMSVGGDLSLFLQGIGSNSGGYGEKADASYSADLFIVIPTGPYGNTYFRGDIGQGDGIGPFMPPTFSGPNADLEFNAPSFELAEAWYSTEFAIPDVKDRRLALIMGKMDPTALFDANAAANSETSQFMADIFVNNTAIEFGGDANGYGPGLSVGYRFTSIYDKGMRVAGRVGMFEGDGDFRDVMDRPFLIAELDAQVPFYGLKGNWRVYGWVNNNRHTDLLDPGRDNLSNHGWGISLDQQVSSDITLFARYGVQDRDVSRFDRVFTAGAQLIGNDWRRANDAIGIAYGASRVSSKFKEASVALDGYPADALHEHYVEAYYRYWANANLSISPDVQYIRNPGGDDGKSGIFIYGVRVQTTF
ncbi:MAG: carbohydrate porin [Deltaproteobacteria bacterium]|nr:carbohydrate porin [Deltaproteobacteria bacterium]